VVNQTPQTLYTIIGTDANSCKYTDQIKITVGDYNNLVNQKTYQYVPGETAKLFVDEVSGSTITWSTKNQTH